MIFGLSLIAIFSVIKVNTVTCFWNLKLCKYRVAQKKKQILKEKFFRLYLVGIFLLGAGYTFCDKFLRFYCFFIFKYKFTGIFRIFWNRLSEQLFGYQARPKTQCSVHIFCSNHTNRGCEKISAICGLRFFATLAILFFNNIFPVN
jgi:hypothetical protein